MLSLTTILWTITWRKFTRYFEHRKDVFPKFWREMWAMITNDVISKIVMSFWGELWAIYDEGVETRQTLCPSSLASIQVSSILKVCEVLMIVVNNNLVGRTFLEVTPLLERINNCQQFFVMDFIIDFYRFKLSWMKCNWMQFLIVCHLWWNTS